jgi:BirA family biotin operon repressor/biotin-[acetyl-CoA-carboxylase] ligase
MRWPNDLLIDRRKLAGILVDSFCPDAAVIGLGINVQNHPESGDTKLSGQTARLADLLSNPPNLDELTALVLRSIRCEIEAFADSGFVLPIPRLNGLWGPPRSVELDLDGNLRRGTFTGVDAEGRLGLWSSDGTLTFYSAHQVRHLTELES